MPDDRRADGADGADRRARRALGLARRAGRAVVGTRAVKEAAESGGLELVALADDASENARGRVRSVLRDPGIRVIRCGDRASLGSALGRGPVVVAGVTDPGLARKVAEAAGSTGTGGAGPEGSRPDPGNDGRPAGKKKESPAAPAAEREKELT